MERGDEAAADGVLEIGFWWGASLLELKRVGARAVTAGGASGNDFWAELPGLGERFELVRADAGERVLNVPPGATAELDGIRVEGPGPHRLTGCARAVVRLGAQAFVLAWSAPVPKTPRLAPDPAFARLVAATAMVSVAALGALEQRPPDDFAEVGYVPPPMVLRALLRPPEKEKKPVPANVPVRGVRRRGAEGKEGDPSASQARAQLSAHAHGPKRYELSKKIASMWGFDEPGVAAVFGPGGSEQLNQALNHLRPGTALGPVAGMNGMWVRGRGPGGGGLADIGQLGVRHPGDGDGTDPFLPGRELKKPPAAVIEKHTEVVGGCEKTSVARVIGRNASAIRNCYETELQKDPGLAGKVALSFTIGADGAVSSVEVSEDTVGDPALVACMRQRVGRWRFPEPKGGGECVINYPWQLRSAAE